MFLIILLMSEDYVTTKEAASILEVSEGRVRQFVRSGKLASYKRGRDHLFRRADLEDFSKKPRKRTGRPATKKS